MSGNDDASSEAQARGQSFALLGGGSDVTTTATTSPTVNTTASGSITSGGDIVIESVVETGTQSLGSGVTGAGLVAVGLLTATATDDPTVGAGVTGSGSVVSTGGDVRVSALHNFVNGAFLGDTGHTATASIESIGISLGVSVQTATINAEAEGNVAATTGSGTNIAAPASGHTVTVESRSSSLADARAKTIGGAFVHVSADINPTARAEGITSANLLGDVRQGTNAGADFLNVIAQGSNLATSVLDTSDGGAINVDANTASNAYVPGAGSDPSGVAAVNAQLGQAGSNIVVTHDASVKAAGITDADATTSSGSGGVINVHSFAANVVAAPHINVSVGAGALITAGTVTVDASNDTTPPVYSDGTFDASTGVNRGDNSIDGNTITFSGVHGLNTGQVVTYETQGNTPIGNGTSTLTDGRQYSVIVPVGSGIDSTKTLQLGSLFDGTSVSPSKAAGVDVGRDEIVFAGQNNFVDGDQVYYFPASNNPADAIGGLVPGKLYTVHVVDPFTIKLLDPLAPAPSVSTSASSVSTDTVNATNTFVNGEAVTYRAPTPDASFSSGVVDLEVANNTGKLALDSSNQPEYNSPSDDTIFVGTNPDPNNAGQFLDHPNFTNGEKVYYTATGGSGKTLGAGIVSGQYYYVHVVDPYRIQLTATQDQATGANNTAITPLALFAPTAFTDDDKQVVHSLVSANNAPLTGLVDGDVYFIRNRTSGSFQLADESGNPVSFSNGGTGGGPHTFDVEGVNLTSAGNGSQELIFDLTGGGSGTQLLSGVGGGGALAGAPTGDERATASASGSSGGVIDVKSASANSTVAPVVTNTIGAGAIVQATSITITTDNRGLVGASTENGGGGLVSVGTANATTSVTTTTTLIVANTAQLVATQDITINAGATNSSIVKASTDGRGLGAGVHSSANSTLKNTTQTIIQGTLSAGGDVVVQSTTSLDGSAYADSYGGGLGVDADATANAIVDPNSLTQTEIEGTARISGEHVQINAFVASASLNSKALSTADAFAADSHATANSNLAGTAEVLIQPHSPTAPTDVQITGNQAIWIQSKFSGIDLDAYTDAAANCFAGHADAESGIDLESLAKVVGENEAFLKTSDLTVDANQYISHFDNTNHNSHGGFLVSHDHGKDPVINARREIFWEATTIMLGEANPVLVIDSTGKITEMVNVTVKDDTGASYGLGDTIPEGRKIEVGDIQYNTGGVARFQANDLAFDDGSDLKAAPDSQIWGNAGLFDYQETFDYVHIDNSSDRELVTHLIDVVNGKQSPLITVSVDHIPGPTDNPANDVSLAENADSGSTFEFDVVHTFLPTAIEIRNLQPGGIAPSNIVLAGRLTAYNPNDPTDVTGVTIENPLGTTLIDDQRGSILVSSSPDPAFVLLRTNVLTLNADGGSIGSHTVSTTSGATKGGVITGRAPVPVEMVQYVDQQGVLRPITLSVEASSDAVLDLRAVLRETVSSTPLAVDVASFHAGGDADLHILDSVEEINPAPLGAVHVVLLNAPGSFLTPPLLRSPVGDPREDEDTTPQRTGTGFYNDHFQPDVGTDAATELGAFGGTRTTIDSDYTFSDIRAGNDISIQHVANGSGGYGSTITYTASTDVDATLTEADGGAVIATSDNVGKIDMTTNGFITISEQNGDLRAGDITSTASDVTLTSPASILDAQDGTGTLGTDPTETDVTGTNITMTAHAGTIGLASDPLEIDSSHAAHGDLTATASQSIYVTEAVGDLNLSKVVSQIGDATLITRSGSILDDRAAAISGLSGVVQANNILFNVAGGSVGTSTKDVAIDSAYTGPGVLTANADTSIYITEVTYSGANSNALRVFKAQATTGDVRLTVPDLLSSGQDLILVDAGNILTPGTDQTVPSSDASIAASLRHAVVTAGNSILLLVGDNVTTTDASVVTAGHNIDVHGDYQNVDPTVGTVMDLRGTFTPGPGATDRTAFYGNVDDDAFTFNQTFLGGQTFAYGSNLPTPSGATAPPSDGMDLFVVNQLKSMESSRLLVTPDHGITVRRDTLDLDGQAGTDAYVVNTTGSQSLTPSDYVLNVLDTGAKDDGVDTLTVDGVDPTTNQPGDTSGNDLFLLRKASYLVGRPGAESPAFVALLHGTVAQAQGGTLDPHVERINYDVNINGRLIVNGLGGDDYFASDDNSAITTLDGGAGDDTFQIGQVFGSARMPADVAPEDAFNTILTTCGYLSPGISFPTVIYGGSGNDNFQIYSNQAELRLDGDDGNDSFVVRSFALASGAGYSTSGKTILNAGAGDDSIQYNANAPVSIDGGSGYDKVVVLGTEQSDAFVVTDQGIYGAGLNVTYANVESVEVDGLEGNDTFFVLSTRKGVTTTILGGPGDDTFNVSGDVTQPIVSRDLTGRSGVIENTVTATNEAPGLLPGQSYNGIDGGGLPVSVADALAGLVVLTESGGKTIVSEGGQTDSYTVHLAKSPDAGETVYLTLSAAAAASEAYAAGSRTILISADNGLTWNSALVLKFTAGNYFTNQTILVKAIDDQAKEGTQTVMISTGVLVSDPSHDSNHFDQVAVRNVQVTVLDNDQPDLYITQPVAGPVVLAGDVNTRIQDGYSLSLAEAPAAGKTVTVTLGHDAILALSSADPRFNAAAQTVTFDSTNWSNPVGITITAVDNGAISDTLISTITQTITSTDPAYQGLIAPGVDVKIISDHKAGVLLIPTDPATGTPDGSTVVDQNTVDTYTMRLTMQPQGAGVTVPIQVHTDGQELISSPDARFAVTTPFSTQPFDASSAAAVNLSTDSIAFASAHGFATGDQVIYQTEGGTSLGGLTANQTYWVIVKGANVIQLASTPSNATAGIAIDLTSLGTLDAGASQRITRPEVATVTFDATNWYKNVTITVSSNAAWTPSPGDENTKKFPTGDHLTSQIAGPLSIGGFTNGEPDRSLTRAIIQPKFPNVTLAQLAANPSLAEHDAGPFAAPPFPNSDSTSFDRLNVFDDGSVANNVGTLTGTNLSGLGIAGPITQDVGNPGQPQLVTTPGGITYQDVEILDVLLGQGDDTLTRQQHLDPRQHDVRRHHGRPRRRRQRQSLRQARGRVECHDGDPGIAAGPLRRHVAGRQRVQRHPGHPDPLRTPLPAGPRPQRRRHRRQRLAHRRSDLRRARQ